jgi:hypothetical protein
MDGWVMYVRASLVGLSSYIQGMSFMKKVRCQVSQVTLLPISYELVIITC